MITIEERFAVVAERLRGQIFKEVRETFRRKFGREALTRGNIRKMVHKNLQNGSVLYGKCAGRPSIVAKTVANIREALERCPNARTRNLIC